jgi:hypothetical protein
VLHLWKKYLLVYTQSFPVRVTQITWAHVQFEALPGNPEGVGRHLNFYFERRFQQDYYFWYNVMWVRTSRTGSAWVSWWGFRMFDFYVARKTWEHLADNLVNYVKAHR